MRKSLTFNGTRKSWLHLLQGRTKSPFAPQRNNLLRVPGMPGAHIVGTETDVLYITQPIGFIVNDDEHALKIIDELSEWLITNESVELQFDDEPNRTYYAKIEGTIEEFTKFVNQRSGVLTFLCADPYAYGKERELNLTTTVSNINNQGTAEADPIFELEAKEPITYALIQNHNDEFMMIGEPITVEDTPFEQYERVFYDDANSRVGWTNASDSEIDGGVVRGNIIASNNRFVAESYGTGSSWHGPAIKKSLTTPIKDFRMAAYLGFWNSTPSQVGRVEIYLLDSLGNAVCKVALKDTANGRANTRLEFRAGDRDDGKHIINTEGSKPGTWNNFSGTVRIERNGNRWKCHIANSNKNIMYSNKWTDFENKYTRNVAQVVVHIGAVGTHAAIGANSGLSSISIDKINQEPEGIPYIANTGDIITLDHSKNGEVLINGELYESVGIGTTFFKLDKGMNQIVTYPDNAFNTKLRYRERYR